MPRTSVTQQQRTDYLKIDRLKFLSKTIKIGLLDRGLTGTEVANEIGILPNSFYRKLRTGTWDVWELIQIFRLLKIDEADILKIMR